MAILFHKQTIILDLKEIDRPGLQGGNKSGTEIQVSEALKAYKS